MSNDIATISLRVNTTELERGTLAYRELARGGFTHHSAARRAATAGASVCAWSL